MKARICNQCGTVVSEDCPDFDYFGGGCKGHLKKVTKTDVV